MDFMLLGRRKSDFHLLDAVLDLSVIDDVPPETYKERRAAFEYNYQLIHCPQKIGMPEHGNNLVASVTNYVNALSYMELNTENAPDAVVIFRLVDLNPAQHKKFAESNDDPNKKYFICDEAKSIVDILSELYQGFTKKPFFLVCFDESEYTDPRLMVGIQKLRCYKNAVGELIKNGEYQEILKSILNTRNPQERAQLESILHTIEGGTTKKPVCVTPGTVFLKNSSLAKALAFMKELSSDQDFYERVRIDSISRVVEVEKLNTYQQYLYGR